MSVPSQTVLASTSQWTWTARRVKWKIRCCPPLVRAFPSTITRRTHCWCQSHPRHQPCSEMVSSLNEKSWAGLCNLWILRIILSNDRENWLVIDSETRFMREQSFAPFIPLHCAWSLQHHAFVFDWDALAG